MYGCVTGGFVKGRGYSCGSCCADACRTRQKPYRVSAWWLLVLFVAVLFSTFDARADTATDLAIAGIDAAGILYVYTWGMGVCLSMWALGYAAGVAVKVINAL